MKPLRRFRTPLGLLMTVLVAFWQIASSMPLHSATFYWDSDGATTGNDVNGTNLGGSGLWDTTTPNWWDLTNLVAWPNTNADVAVFTAPVSEMPGTPKTVTLASGVVANKLRFERSGYVLTGGTLTLAGTAPGVEVNFTESAVIDSLIQGTDGFTKTGRGSVRLGNAGNTYTGITTVSNGTLIISDPGALGASTSEVVVAGSASRGFGGGQLMLLGSYGSGMTFTRDLSLQGLGPISDRSAALMSLGNNELSGAISASVGNVSTRLTSANGILTLSGSLNVAGTAASTITSLGSVNSTGTAMYVFTGTLTGTGTLEKAGAGALLFNPSSTSGFSGTLRISGSATGTQSSVRITSPGVLGTRTSTGTGGVLDMNGGVLEVRMDTPSVLGGSTAATVYGRATSTVFADHSVGGEAVNGTVTFNQFTFEDNITVTFSSRNGYNMNFGTASVNGGNANSVITNSLAGLLSYTGNFWSNADNTGNRTMTINGNGNTIINGSIIASSAAFDHILTKGGTGLLTITGTASTLDGAVNIQGGAIAITDFRSLTNNTSAINIGNTTTAGALIIGTSVAATAEGLITNKAINLSGTTGGATIYANQAGTNAVELHDVSATGAGAKTLTLGGTNTADNIITSDLDDSGGILQLAKNGSGTWVLSGENGYTGATTITDGTLKVRDTFSAGSRDVLGAGAITFTALAATGEAGGTFEYVGAAGSASAELVGNLVLTNGAATVKATATGGGSATLTFNSLGARTAGATVNYVPNAGGVIAFTTAPTVTNGIIAAASGGAAFQTFNGVDWATLSGNNVAQYNGYTVNALPASGTGSAGVNFSQSVSAATTGTASINTLKIIGGASTPTITLGGTLTLTAKGLLFDNSAGGALITGSQLGAASVETVIITNGVNANNALTVNSVIGSGSGSLTKSGTGTLVIGGANTYTGNTFINEGTVRLSGATATLGVISTAGNVTTVRQGALLDINAAGASNTVTIGGLNGAGTVTNSGGGLGTSATLSIGSGTSTAAGTFGGVLQDGAGILNVTKNGTGVQTLTGLNTYTGVTRILSTGSITVNVLANIGQASGIGAGEDTNDATNAASLVFAGSTGGLVYAGSDLVGGLTLGSNSASTNRLFTLAGTGATLSSNASNNNAVVFTNEGDIVHGVIGPQSLILTGTSTGDNRLNPRITDSGTGANITSVTKTGAGKWVLGNENNTYSGLTTVANGTLEFAYDGSLSDNSGLVLGSTTTSGVVEMSGVFERALSATPTAGAVTWNSNLTTGGGGFAASTSKLVVAIGGQGTETTLVWNAGGFVKTGASLVLSSATALADVEFRNAIDLNGAARTITVNDNAATGADFATISGVISNSTGSSGLTKAGGGLLQLVGDNTYNGITAVIGGTLVVRSLGNSSTPGASSVGDSTNAATDVGAVTLGNAGTTAGILQYVGAGEVSDRKIRINTTTGNTQLHADGSGALILTNVQNDMAAGVKVLFLRGTSTAGNMITSQLNDNGGALSITVDGGATWILTNAANSFSGTVTVSGGAFGLGSDTALGTSTLALSNGSIFAYGGDRVITNAVTQGNNTSVAFIGENSLNFTSIYQSGASANSPTFTNNIAAGKTLTFAGFVVNALTAARTFTFTGSGDTIINGNITTSTEFALNITYAGTGSLTLAGNASDWNTGLLTVSNGTLRIGNDEVISHGSATESGNVVISPAAGVTATFDLNGFNETINGLTANSAGNIIIDNTSSNAASLTFGSNDQAVDIGTGAGSYTITDSGAGALSITKTGSGAAVIGGGVTLTYQGMTSVTGGTFTINSALNGTTGLSVTGTNSALFLNGGITNPAVVSTITVGNGSTLSLVDGAGNKFNNLSALTLGSSGGTQTTLNLNVGDGLVVGDMLNTDFLNLLSGGALTLFAGNKILLNLTDAGLNANTTYHLLDATGGFTTGPLSSADWLLGASPGGFTSIQLVVTDGLISVTTGDLIVGSLYWNGGGGADVWNDVNNWSTDKDGTLVATTIPGQGSSVIFVADNVAGGAVTTTLEQNFKINSLRFESSDNTPTSVTINPGAVTTNRLEIAPQNSADGIFMTADGPNTVTIATALRLGANQTWTVSGAGSTLTLSGALSGERDVTKAGLGKLVLSGAADASFNTGLTTDFNITGGTVEMTNLGALGSVANNNLANITIGSGGAFYYANATAGNLGHAITLDGGTLSGSLTNHTYSGAININSNSFINMRDANSTDPATAARNIALTGMLSGFGKLTVDSSSAISGTNLNQITGTLTLSNSNFGWSGGIDLIRGTITATNIDALGSGNINANFGRIIFNTAGGSTFNISQNVTLDAPGGILELQADASGTPVSDMTVNFTGTLMLGGVNSNMALRLLQATDNFSVLHLAGPVILGGNASISTAGSSTRASTISGEISELGGSFGLTINDDLGGWGQTNQTLRLTGLNTFTGSITVASGTLEFTTVSDNGGPASSLGRGTDGITLGGGSLSFIGSGEANSQTTNRAINTTASSTLAANGTDGASITYTGAITQVTNNALTLSGSAQGIGIITGSITQGGTSADLNVTGGTWTLIGNTKTIADDTIVSGANTVLNLNSTGVLTGLSGTSNGLYIRSGATINLNANDAYSTSTGLDFIIMGDNAVGGSTLNTNTFNITTPRLDLGQATAGFTASIIGSGTVTVGTNINLYQGSISAKLAGGGAILKAFGGTVTLSGDNSGLTGGTAARVDAGTLILDYTTSNTTKLRTATGLDMRGGTLVLEGNASEDTTQTVASLTLGGGGSSKIIINSNGFATTLNLGNITRTALGLDGTMRFELPVLGNITTTTANTNGILGGYATVRTISGETNFAANDGSNNIVAVVSTELDDITQWSGGLNVTDVSGFTGTSRMVRVNSIRFNADAASLITLLPGGSMVVGSGGILMTDEVTTGAHVISGGFLSSANGEIIFTQESTAQALTVSSSILSGGLTKSGNGTLVLSGVNHYTSQTDIQAGTLIASGGFAIGDASAVNIADDKASRLELAGSETIGALAGGNATANLVVGVVDVGTHTLTVRGGGTYGGIFEGSGTIIRDNTVNGSNLNLTGNSTGFTGHVIVNGGLFQISGASGRMNGAASFTINKGGNILIDNDDDSAPNDRISDLAEFTLNSADGTFSGATVVRGLAVRTNNNSNESETIGVLKFASGANYFAADASGGTSTVAAIVADDFVRTNNATLNARGRNLGGGSAERSQLRIGTAANQTAFIGTANNANLVGGDGVAGSKTIDIVPWAIGENTTTTLADTNMGNSLVTYVTGTGFRALDFATEYNTFGTREGATDNIRESLGGDLTNVTGVTINALVLHNNNTAASTVNVTGAGAGQTLRITSGALLFTLNPGADAGSAHSTVLGGFDGGIEMGGAGITSEYVIHVVNPSSAAGAATLTATISSSLTSAADITKSGRGTLILTGINAAGGDTKKTTINEGILEISDLDNIGGNSGGLVFAGGTLRLASGFLDDLSLRSVTILQGGGTLDTNGLDLNLTNGFTGGGSGSFTKAGLGTLTFSGNATYTGDTFITNGRIVLGGGANNRLASTAGVALGSGTDSGVLQLGNAAGATNQTVDELSTVGTGTENAIVGGNGTLSILTVNQNTSTTFAGNIGGLLGDENNLSLVKSGVGILTLSGSTISYVGTTTVNGGILNITGSAAAALSTSGMTVVGNAGLNTINGVGQSINLGAGPLSLGIGSGATVLGFELGATSAYDSLNTTGAATTANTIVFNLTGLTGFGPGNYDLLTAGSGLSGGSYVLGTLSGAWSGVTLNLITTDTFVRLSTTASTGDFYWRGGINNSWLGNSGTNTNFTTDLAGTINANGTPGAASTVYFSAANATGPSITTTLDGNFTINDLRFLASPAGVTSVIIAPGSPTTNSLTIAPSSSSVGIDVADNAGAVNISAPLVLGADQTWHVAGTGLNGSSLTISGVITGAGNLEKTGQGILTFSAANTYTGVTTVTEGVLQTSASNRFSALSAHVIGPDGILRLNGFSNAIGSLAGSGIVQNNTVTAVTLTAGANNTSTTFSGVLQNGFTAALGFVKTGTGTLILAGANTHTGTTTVNAGVLQIGDGVSGSLNTGTGNIAVSNSATTAVLRFVSGTSNVNSVLVGNAANSLGSFNMVDGVLNVNVSNSDSAPSVGLGTANGGFGSMLMSGGTINATRFYVGGTSSTTAAGGIGVALITGGTLNVTNATDNYIMISRHGASTGVLTITGGTINHNTGTQNINLGWQGSGRAELNVAGGFIDNSTRSVVFGGSSWTGTGILNINAGVLLTNSITHTSGTSILNFNGGTLRAATNSATFVPTGVTNTYVNGAFGSFAGGAVIDTNGFAVTIPEALISPTGNGVMSVSLGAGGTGYTGAPLVQITGDGVGATGYAVVDTDPLSATFGQVTSVVITNPGVNYTSATINLVGGGGTGASASVTLGANTSGGLTKIGLGTLTLTGINQYTGGTFVNEGTLALGASGVLEDTGAVTVNGGEFNLATFTETVGTVTLQNGSITGSTGVLSGSSYILENGLVSANLTGSGSLTKTTAGTVTLSGTNTFSGSVNVNGGTLAFGSAASLGDGSATNTISVNGATMRYIGSGSTALNTAQAVTVGAGDATFDVTNSTGTFTVNGNVTGSAGGDLVKVGSGTLVLAGTNNLGAGGAVNVADGTLRAGFGTGGVAAITVGSSGTLEFANNAAQALTLTGTPGALTLSSGATLGFELGTLGNNDSIIIAAGGTAVTSGSITLNFLNLGGLSAGTYDLITILGGGGGLNAANYIVGNAPTGFNYSIAKSENLVQLIVSVLSFKYWRGDQSASWSLNNAGNTNWSSDAAGTTDPGNTPGAADTVIFSATSAPFTGGSAINTTLDGNTTIDGLQFLSVPTGVTSVSIAQGSSGTLTITPASAANGILVAANGGNITISAPLIAGAMQTWNVDGTGANGSSLVVSGNTTFTGRVTKTGGGVLTLSGSNTGGGGFTLSGGTLNINSTSALGTGLFTIGAGTTINNTTAGSITLTANNVMAWDGGFIFTGTQALNLGTGAVTLGANATVTTTASTLTVGGNIGDGANDFTLTKAGAGTLTLTGASTWSGGMTLTDGTLNINSSSALGTGTFTINGGTINNSTAGALTLTANNAMVWNGSFVFTGTQALNLGAGAVTLGGNVTVTTTANTLSVGGAIDDGTNGFSLTKAGTGTLHLAGNSTYDGATVIQTGTVTVGVDNALPTGTALTVGSGSTAATLNLGNFSQTVGSLASTANTATVSEIVINAGETLTVNGNVTMSNNTDNAQTHLRLTGGGSLIVEGATFSLGQNTTGSNNSSWARLDLSGLSSFTAKLTGAMTIQLQGDNGSGHLSRLTLSNTANTITAASVTVGGSATAGQQVLILGAGTNVINANSVNVGTGSRDSGSFSFGGNATGTVVIRNTAGTGRAAFNMGTGSATTSGAATNVFDVSGHDADLLLGAVNIGTQNRGINYTNTFSFDEGTLDMTSLTMSTRTGNSANGTTRTTTSILNIGGGIVNIQNGILNLGRAAGSYTTANEQAPVMNATINITAGTVTIGQTGGVAIRMAEYLATGGLGTGSANGVVNITGGKVTVNGDIIRVTNTENASAVVTLDGAAAELDMAGNDIGTLASAVTFNAQQGTLMNLGQLNGGAGLTKSGMLTLILEGFNTYTGGTTISSGVLQVGSGSSTGNLGSGTVTNNATLRFNRDNAYTVSQNITGSGSVEQVGTGTTVLEGENDYSGGTSINAGTLQVNSAGALGSTGAIKFGGGTLQYTANNTADYSARIADSTGAIRVDTNGQTVTYGSALNSTNVGGLTKEGAGSLRLGVANSYTGTTTVNGGTLVANHTGALSSGDVVVNSGGALSVGDGARLQVNVGGSLTSSGTLEFDIFNHQAGDNPLGNNDVLTFTSIDGSDSISLSGTLKVVDTTGTSSTWALDDVWQLIDWAGFAGAIPAASENFGGFTTLDLPTLGTGLSWRVITDVGGLSIAVVPEPSRALLFGLGFVMLFLRRRRR